MFGDPPDFHGQRRRGGGCHRLDPIGPVQRTEQRVLPGSIGSSRGRRRRPARVLTPGPAQLPWFRLVLSLRSKRGFRRGERTFPFRQIFKLTASSSLSYSPVIFV